MDWELEAIWSKKAEEDGHFAIAFGLQQVADAIRAHADAISQASHAHALEGGAALMQAADVVSAGLRSLERTDG